MKQSLTFRSTIFLIMLIAGNYSINAQPGTIRGKVLDSATGKAIEYTSVLNFSKGNRIYSNSSGEFSMNARPGDTLVFYAVGYYYQKIIVEEAMLNDASPEIFNLQQQAFEIAEVHIIDLGTYEEFKEQFVNLERPRSRTQNLAEDLAETSRIAAVEAFNKSMAEQKLGGVTFLTVPILTPEEKERRVLAEIIEKEKIHDQVYQKFNPVIVKKVTGLTDDDEVIEFMVYCDFSDAYLLSVNEYDLMVNLARKFELFRKKREEEKNMQNRLDPGDASPFPNA